MRLCYLGTFEKDYPRNETFIKGLQKQGIDVAVFNCSVRKDPSVEFKGLALISFPFRLCIAYLRLIWHVLMLEHIDAVMIGYPAHLDVIILYPFIRLKRFPLFFNPLVSLYDTFVEDRKRFARDSLPARLIYHIDRLAFGLPDAVFIDTKLHGDFITSLLSFDASKMFIIPVGAEEEYFSEEAVTKQQSFTVFFFGKYIPLHGIETIIDAAQLLKGRDIRFVLVGRGQAYDSIREKADGYGLKNITFIDWMSKEELVRNMRSSHVVLGIFRKDGKAQRVVPNKVYQALATGSAVITGRSPAMQEFFVDGQDILMTEPEDAAELARKILWVKDHCSEAELIAKKGQEKVRSFASEEQIGGRIKEIIERTVARLKKG